MTPTLHVDEIYREQLVSNVQQPLLIRNSPRDDFMDAYGGVALSTPNDKQSQPLVRLRELHHPRFIMCGLSSCRSLCREFGHFLIQAFDLQIFLRKIKVCSLNHCRLHCFASYLEVHLFPIYFIIILLLDKRSCYTICN